MRVVLCLIFIMVVHLVIKALFTVYHCWHYWSVVTVISCNATQIINVPLCIGQYQSEKWISEVLPKLAGHMRPLNVQIIICECWFGGILVYTASSERHIPSLTVTFCEVLSVLLIKMRHFHTRIICYAAKEWDDIIPEVERKKIEEAELKQQMEELNLPPRSRKQINDVWFLSCYYFYQRHKSVSGSGGVHLFFFYSVHLPLPFANTPLAEKGGCQDTLDNKGFMPLIYMVVDLIIVIHKEYLSIYFWI